MIWTRADAAFGEIGIGEQVPQFRPFVGVLLIRMDLHATYGRHAAALADYAEATRRTGGMRTGPLLEDWLVAIESMHAIGDHDAALAQLDDALEVARSWGTDSAIGSALRVRGRLERDSTHSIDYLHAATEHLDRSPRHYEYARALVDLGAALRRAGARAGSRDPLRAGYELARECGADGLAETARQELAASGVRIRRERLSGTASLTPSEATDRGLGGRRRLKRGDRAGAVRNPQDRRDAPDPCLPQARHYGPQRTQTRARSVPLNCSPQEGADQEHHTDT